MSSDKKRGSDWPGAVAVVAYFGFLAWVMWLFSQSWGGGAP